MSPQAQRIAIAETCPDLVEWHDGVPYWKGHWSAVGEGNEHFAEFNPAACLNAMHDAEKTIKGHHRWGEYKRRLSIICCTGDEFPVDATAAHRAEAFLRVMNLWKEDAS